MPNVPVDPNDAVKEFPPISINVPTDEESWNKYFNPSFQSEIADQSNLDINNGMMFAAESTDYPEQYLSTVNPGDPIYVANKKKTTAPHIRRLRTYNPYQLPDIDISGPGFERKRISLLKVNRPNVFEFRGETNATLQVMDRDGNVIFPTRIQDIENPYETWYYNFLLTGVTEQRQEVAQISRMFGNALEINMFGSNPIMLGCTGYLINTEHYRWADEWVNAYELYLKGTKCIENNARIYLSYDNKIVEGYMLSTSPVKDANRPLVDMFQFSFLVIKSVNTEHIPPATEVEFSPQEGGKIYDLEIVE